MNEEIKTLIKQSLAIIDSLSEKEKIEITKELSAGFNEACNA